MNKVQALTDIKIIFKITLISKRNFLTNSCFKGSNKLTLCVFLGKFLMFLRAFAIFPLLNKWIFRNKLACNSYSVKLKLPQNGKMP